MIILYNTTINKQFGSKTEWFLDVNFEKEEVEWIIYPHAPDGMHAKLADSYGGLGSKHYNGKQSFDDFKLNSKYELNKVIYAFIYLLLDNYDNDIHNMKKINYLLGVKK